MWRYAIAVFASALTLACAVRGSAIRSDGTNPGSPGSEQDSATTQETPTAPAVTPDRTRPPLKIENIRLDPVSATDTVLSAIVRFDMINEGANALTDLVFDVSIVEQPEPDRGGVPPRVLAGPFTIQGHVVLDAGFTLNYEMVVRKLPSPCRCVATVRVQSARAVPHAGS